MILGKKHIELGMKNWGNLDMFVETAIFSVSMKGWRKFSPNTDDKLKKICDRMAKGRR